MTETSNLRILVVGSGGREHALAWKLSQSPSVDLVHVAPGNGGTEAAKVVNVPVAGNDYPALVAHAKRHGINLAVVGPEAPLVDGIEGFFRAAGIRCFGPSKSAAQMEGSKAFSKDFMQRQGIPTAAFRSFDNHDKARKYLDELDHAIVIKADGLAAGKGVIIPNSKEEARTALKEIMLDRQFGSAGDKVVIEEFLQGQELSVLSFSDGYTVRSLPPAQDHKRALDDDQGLNTGGMGAYAPATMASEDLIVQIDQTIVQPTIDCMRRDGMPFVGMLFTGLMITEAGPKVLEYNVRGGDPETQTLLPLLSKDTDLAKVMVACTEHWLDGVELKLEPRFSTTVVACAEGYPEAYAKHRTIQLEKPTPDDVLIFHAGTSRTEDSKLITTGGRVIASTATGETLQSAVDTAYKGMNTIKFDGMHYRKDIAHHGLAHRPKRKGSNTSISPLTYADAGVSIDSGNSLVSRIKASVKSTARAGADAEIGGFGGAFDLAQAGYDKNSPVLIGAIDGVGTKLKIAFALNKHDTVGVDLVAMNVNDLVVQGAEPLMFLDCYTCSVLDVDVAADFVSGVARGCRLAHCALVGGETAEMPGLLQNNEYDAVGAAVGALKPSQTILPDKKAMTQGDILLGLGSDGLHSNGFSLVRRIVQRSRLGWFDPTPWESSDKNTDQSSNNTSTTLSKNTEKTLGESLLIPTRIYVRSLLTVLTQSNKTIKGLSHVTGGGLTENVPRMLPAHLAARIDLSSWERPPVFPWLQRTGKVSDEEMLRTFNNGIGMVCVVASAAAREVMEQLEQQGERVFEIGTLVSRPDGNEGCVFHASFRDSDQALDLV